MCVGYSYSYSHSHLYLYFFRGNFISVMVFFFLSVLWFHDHAFLHRSFPFSRTDRASESKRNVNMYVLGILKVGNYVVMVLSVLFSCSFFKELFLHSFIVFFSLFFTTNCMLLLLLLLLLFECSNCIFGLLTTFILVYILHSTSKHTRIVRFLWKKENGIHLRKKTVDTFFLGQFNF